MHSVLSADYNLNFLNRECKFNVFKWLNRIYLNFGQENWWKLAILILILCVGISSLFIGGKFLFAKQIFPYHEKIIEISWQELPKNFKNLMITLLKMAGSGIFALGFLNLAFGFIYWKNSLEVQPISILLIADFICWFSIFMITFSTFRKTKVETPWKSSAFILILIIISLILIFLK